MASKLGVRGHLFDLIFFNISFTYRYINFIKTQYPDHLLCSFQFLIHNSITF